MGAVTTDQMNQLANTIASFHDSEAKRSRSSSIGTAKILEYAEQNIDLLLTEPLLRPPSIDHELANWTPISFENFHPHFVNRELGVLFANVTAICIVGILFIGTIAGFHLTVSNSILNMLGSMF